MPMIKPSKWFAFSFAFFAMSHHLQWCNSPCCMRAWRCGTACGTAGWRRRRRRGCGRPQPAPSRSGRSSHPGRRPAAKPAGLPDRVGELGCLLINIELLFINCWSGWRQRKNRTKAPLSTIFFCVVFQQNVSHLRRITGPTVWESISKWKSKILRIDISLVIVFFNNRAVASAQELKIDSEHFARSPFAWHFCVTAWRWTRTCCVIAVFSRLFAAAGCKNTFFWSIFSHDQFLLWYQWIKGSARWAVWSDGTGWAELFRCCAVNVG